MKYLKTFENYSEIEHGRFSEEEDFMSNENPYQEIEQDEEECAPCEDEENYQEEEEEENPRYIKRFSSDLGNTPKVWGDEQMVEAKKAKPDFLDLDKDGDKKESMKKAAKEAKEKGGKEDKKAEKDKEEKSGKGLTKAQSKLPEGLRKAIEAKKKK